MKPLMPTTKFKNLTSSIKNVTKNQDQATEDHSIKSAEIVITVPQVDHTHGEIEKDRVSNLGRDLT